MFDQVDDHVAAVLDELPRIVNGTGAVPCSVTSVENVTTCPDTTSLRCVYRVTLSDGKVVKVRRLHRPDSSQDALRWLQLLDSSAFARVHESRTTIWVEAWVPGVALSDLEVETGDVVRAAEILSELHTVTQLGAFVVRGERETDEPKALFERDLGVLTEAGRLGRTQTLRLRDLALSEAPSHAETGLIHNDYCAPNLVRDASGNLTVIDNEAMEVGFLDWDVARTWSRWPMSERHWSTFLSAYSKKRQCANGGNFRFWKLVALARTARFFARTRPSGPNRGLELLQEIGGGRGEHVL